MATGLTTNYSFSYPLSTDPVNVAADMEGIAVDLDTFLLSPLFKGHVRLNSGLSYKINNNTVLSETALGSSVVSSSLTSVGTITTGTWSATEIAANKGGTGQTSYTVGDILYASSSSELSKLPSVATGNTLISGGIGSAPSWGKIGLTTHVSGTLPVANGGTGSTTSTGSGSAVLDNSPALSGVPTAPTADVDTNTTQIATTAYVIGQGYLKSTTAASTYAPLASPTFTGTVTVPTPTSNSHATTKLYVDTAVAGVVGALPSQTGNSGKILTTDGTTASWTSTPVLGNTTTGYLTVSATDGINEGGEILLKGSGSYADWAIDNYQGTVRMHSAGVTRMTVSSSGTTLGGTTTVTSPTAAGSTGVRQITMSTSSPSGGADGDVWLVYV